MNPEALVFDLDGTLWDSTETCMEAWAEAIAEFDGVPPVTREQMWGAYGTRFDLIGAMLFPTLEKSRQDAVLARCQDRENSWLARVGGALYPGIEETLGVLKRRYRLFMVSNCQDGYIEACFQAHGLGRYFEDYESAGRSGLSKAENIRLILGRNRVGPAVYIGDTLGDQDASRAAGVPFVFASYGFGTADKPEFTVSSPGELTVLFPG